MKLAALGGSLPAPRSSTGSFCDLVPGLSGRQRRLCERRPDAMRAVERGVHAAVGQCQRHFHRHRWNCTTYDRAGYGSVLFKAGSREAAFVYAVTAAGVVHSVARACAAGEVLGCGCADLPADGRVHVHKRLGPFRWGGCGDNLKYASSFARRFMDARERHRRPAHAASLMNLHNNRVGRKLARRTADIRCKCHGVSGACTARTCWRVAAPLQQIAAQLKDKYFRATLASVRMSADGSVEGLAPAATEVQPLDNSIPQTELEMILNRARRREPAKLNKLDLVFLEPSPDYCDADFLLGSLGTAGRECSLNASAPDACNSLCCGRGFTTTRTVIVDDKCNCTFVWCCKVECRTCRRERDVHTCNGPAGADEHFRPRQQQQLADGSLWRAGGGVVLRDAADSWNDYRRLRNYN